MLGAVVLPTLVAVGGCTRQVTGVAVGLHDNALGGNVCTAVSAPMTPIPTHADDVSRVLIPQPSGWDRTSTRVPLIRFAMMKKRLTADDFGASAVVALAVSDALLAAGVSNLHFAHLAVRGMPGSGSGAELMAWAGIDADHITKAARDLTSPT